MPRRRSKKVSIARGPRPIDLTHTDFSVYDCFPPCKPSDTHREQSTVAASTGVRVSKAISRSWQTEVRHIAGRPAETVLPPDTTIEEEEEWDSVADHTSGSKKNLPLVNGIQKTSSQSAGEYIYPLDLWYCVGKYIDPADISRFAQICHGTHVVVHSAQFWFIVYNRFCRLPTTTTTTTTANLPSSLQPDAVLHRVHGLRTRVIRALFHVYPPLSSRLTQTTALQTLDQDLNRLVGLRCVRAWQEQSFGRRPASGAGGQQQQQQQWRFCFKFERALPKSRQVSCPLSPQRDPSCDHQLSHGDLLAHDDVMHNPDERSVLLVAVTSHYTPLPIVMGLVLIKAAASSDGLFAHRLRLIFYNQYIQSGRGSLVPSGAVSVELETINTVNVLNWWHSSYPGVS